LTQTKKIAQYSRGTFRSERVGSGYVTMLSPEICLRVLHNNIQKPIKACLVNYFKWLLKSKGWYLH